MTCLPNRWIVFKNDIIIVFAQMSVSINKTEYRAIDLRGLFEKYRTPYYWGKKKFILN